MKKLIEKLKGLFGKAKALTETLRFKISAFVREHKSEIRTLMQVLQTIYARNNGTAKMENVVLTVCSALGAENIGNIYADDVVAFVEKQCQKVYDELLVDGGLQK